MGYNKRFLVPACLWGNVSSQSETGLYTLVTCSMMLYRLAHYQPQKIYKVDIKIVRKDELNHLEMFV